MTIKGKWNYQCQNSVTQSMPQISQSQLITMKLYLYLTQVLPFPECFDKLDLKPKLTHTHIHKVNGAGGNSLSPLGTTICTLEFPRKCQQQFIVCEHLLWPITLGLDFSHNYMIGIDWFYTKQLHLHQGPWSIIVSDPTPFPLHINQISTLLPPHLLVKTISQVAVPSRTLAIVPATLTGNLKPKHYYSLTGTQSSLEQNLFFVPLLEFSAKKLSVHLQCIVINTSPDDVILPKNWHIGEMTSLSHTDNSVQHINEVSHNINPNIVSASWRQQNIDPHTKYKTHDDPQPIIKTSLLITK